MVQIVVPIYREIPTPDDLISLEQLVLVLGKHNITFVHPKKMNTAFYKKFNASLLGFEDYFFENIHGYNKLMLSVEFYKSFSEKFILIYQTDCFVFKDQLLFWCKKDFDYVGAPWIRSLGKIPFYKMLWDKTVYFTKSLMNYNGNGKTQKDKSLLYNEVGNGGLSLRNREKCIEVLEKLPEVVKIYENPKNTSQFFVEDVFFSIEPKRNSIFFTKPNYKEACQFSIENKQEKAMKINQGELPFGCHRWTKEKSFWRKYFAEFGYKI